ETHYWLRLLKDSDYLSNGEFIELENELNSILKILFKIIQSSKE
ncbi:MAG: four helix bundle protein, partial [Flavobacteriales bacterium]|nr:four helix bundle protein [Flavobacteriales bacterium]